MAGIATILFDTDEAAAKCFGDSSCRASAGERVENKVILFTGCQQHAVQQAFRLLCRVNLLAIITFQALLTCADRDRPVRPHL